MLFLIIPRSLLPTRQRPHLYKQSLAGDGYILINNTSVTRAILKED